MPESLSWLPLVESGFKDRALSTARALGLWQFIPSTGYRYGLDRSDSIDERMDPEKSTAAALAGTLVGSQAGDGSWNSACIWGGYGGKVYTTALATMCLEVYYRYTPETEVGVAHREPWQTIPAR